MKKMPIPKPTTNESEDEFISRCMGDDTMNEDYPDQEQRSGVCFSTWRNRDKMMTKHITIPLEIKVLKKREFEGYGSVFGNKDLGDDVVMPGAFSRTLATHKNDGTLPVMFWMHDPTRVPGKWLDMGEDDKGLYVKGILADTDLGNEIHTLLGMKAVSGLSIGYTTHDADYTDDGTRLLKDVDLWETSIVSIPMNPSAQIMHAKSQLSARGEYVFNNNELSEFKRDLEQYFRSKGLSKINARTYVSNCFKDQIGAMPNDPGATPDDDALTAAYEELELMSNAGEMPGINRKLDQLIKNMGNDLLAQEMKLHNL